MPLHILIPGAFRDRRIAGTETIPWNRGGIRPFCRPEFEVQVIRGSGSQIYSFRFTFVSRRTHANPEYLLSRRIEREVSLLIGLGLANIAGSFPLQYNDNVLNSGVRHR